MADTGNRGSEKQKLATTLAASVKGALSQGEVRAGFSGKQESMTLAAEFAARWVGPTHRVRQNREEWGTRQGGNFQGQIPSE